MVRKVLTEDESMQRLQESFPPLVVSPIQTFDGEKSVVIREAILNEFLGCARLHFFRGGIAHQQQVQEEENNV